MVQFGCCLSISSFVPQFGKEAASPSNPLQELEAGLSIVRDNGYDFAELTVGTLTQLSEEDFAAAKEIIRRSGIPVPVCNSFIPPSLPLTGPEVRSTDIENYLALAMSRVHEIGGRYIIFGSGGARRVPAGFSMEKACEQMIVFLQMCEKYGSQFDIDVAIEPLNKNETNLIHRVEEAYAMASSLALPHIKVLADTYHMHLEEESYEVLRQAADRLIHIHIADKARKYPGQLPAGGVDFAAFFHTLQSIGYTGGISAECRFDNLERDSGYSLEYVKKIWTSVE